MNQKIKALFFDIDGTLVSFQTHLVPESARRAIAEVRARGIKVFISTGRLLRHAKAAVDLEVDGYITVNGGHCITAQGDEIYVKSFSRELVARIFALGEEYGFHSALLTESDIYVGKIDERVQYIADMINIPPCVADLNRVVEEQKVFQVCPYIGEDLERVIAPLLPECTPSRWMPLFMDFNIKGVDKSAGAKRVAEYYGLSMDEVMAFGDGGNDISIVRDAGVGVAMGNACDELKAVADYVTTSVDDDGIYNALKHFGLI